MWIKLWNKKWFQTVTIIVAVLIVVLVILNLALRAVKTEITTLSKTSDKIYILTARLVRNDSIQFVNDSIQDGKIAHLPESPLSPDELSRITSNYNFRTDPATGKRTLHAARDYAAKKGTVVFAAAAGVVEKAEMNIGYGKMIKINHLNGYKTLYAHLSSMDVLPGYLVQKGDTIGTIGNTGSVRGINGYHLHYEITFVKDGKETPVNPGKMTSL
jgi:murein DD-endopeptidase MepM/ murein hydrolase activator NlpD